MDSAASVWAHEELRAVSLGDAQRTERAITVLAQRASAPHATLAQAAGTEADTEATYRFSANDAVRPAAILAAHQDRTRERLAEADEEVILAVQDTTQLDFSHHPEIAGIGVIDHERRYGLLVHTTLAVTPQRVPLGVWAILAREENPPAGVAPIEWLLLTTLTTATFEQVCVRMGWCSCRWVAEMYHRVLKSGCQIERRQFDALDNLRRYLAIDSLVAWWVLYLTVLGRQTPDVSCTALFIRTCVRFVKRQRQGRG